MTSTHALFTSPRLATLALGAALLASCGSSSGTTDPPVEPPPSVDLPEFAYPTRVLLTEYAVAMTPQVPSATGPNPLGSWALQGDLPSGVVFDTGTGTISGTPGELASPRSLRVSNTNNDGTFVQELSLSVSGTERFAYSANAGDNTLTKLLADDELGILENSGYLVQTAGESSPQDVQADPEGRVVYAVNSFALSTYLVDSTTGELSAGTPISLGSGPHSLYVHPGGEYVYVSSSGSDRVRVYAVDAISGTLSQIQQVTTANQPTDLAGDPNGRYLVVGHATAEVMENYFIDAVSGTLTLASTLDLPTVVAQDFEMGPLGESLYVVLTQPFQGVLRCDVDTTTGVMELGPTSDAGNGPLSMTVEPGRRFAYVLNQGSANISYYSVTDANGKLTKIGDLPSTAGTVSLRFSSDASRAVAVDKNSRLARLYDLESDGSLTLTSEVKLRRSPRALATVEGTAAVTRVTDVMYALNETSADITVFQVNSQTGLVSDGGLPPIPTGVGPSDLALDPLGRFAFVVNRIDENVTVYAMQPNGDLVDNLTPLDLANTSPSVIEVDPTGRFAYVSFEDFPLLGMFSIGTDGTLTSLGTRSIQIVPEDISIDPAGLYLYSVHGGDRVTEFGSFRVFEIDPSTGALTSIDPLVTASGHPTLLEFASGGSLAYSTQKEADLVVAWGVEQDGSTAAIGSGSTTQNQPVDVALTPDEKLAFVACNDLTGQGSLLVYDVNPDDGHLYNAVSGVPTWRNVAFAGVNPVAVEVSHDGRFTYVLSQTSAELRVFRMDPDTGFLIELQVIARGTGPIELRRRDKTQ